MSDQTDQSGVQSQSGQVGSQDQNGQAQDNAIFDQSLGQGDIGQDNGSSNLPPELEEQRKELLRDYHSKTQALAEDRLLHQQELQTLKERDGMLQQLMGQEWFRQAAFNEQRRMAGGNVDDLNWTPEQFDQIKNDPNAFKSVVMEMAKRVAQGAMQPALGALNEQQMEVQQVAGEQEYEAIASRYKDFQNLNDAGALDEYLDQGHDFEAAYKLAKFDQVGDLDEAAGRRAEQILENSRNGAIGTRGTPGVSGNRVLAKPKNIDQALDAALGEILKGNERFEFQR